MVRALSFAFLAGAAQSADNCPLYAITADNSTKPVEVTCSETNVGCLYTSFAKTADPSLVEGSCADQRYTIVASNTTTTYPFFPDYVIVVTKYCSNAECVAPYSQGLQADTCSLFAITGDSCSESELRCDYTKYAKLAEKALADGTCADQGYTVETSTSTKTYPIVGDIKVTTYSQGMLETKEAETCCVDDACVAPKVKYYSVDLKHGFCGEACMDPSKFGIYKIFEKNLTLSESFNPCSEQFTPFGTHYTEYNDTVTHGLPGVLTVTLDLYGPGPALGAVSV